MENIGGGPPDNNDFSGEQDPDGAIEPHDSGVYDLSSWENDTTNEESEHIVAETGDQQPFGVDPKELALRYGLASGLLLVRDRETAPNDKQNFSLNVMGEPSNGASLTANLIVETVTRDPANNEVLGATYRTTPVGHYDPAQGEWKLYPELVHDDEVEELQTVFEDMASSTENVEGGNTTPSTANASIPLATLRHPLTVQARIETAAMMREDGIAEIVLDRATDAERHNPFGTNPNSYSVDGHTTYSLCIIQSHTPEAYERAGMAAQGPYPAARLIARYDGAVVRTADGVWRENLVVELARRPEAESVWQPRTNVVTPRHWEVLRNAPGILAGYKMHDPHFSLQHCAMVDFPETN